MVAMKAITKGVRKGALKSILKKKPARATKDEPSSGSGDVPASLWETDPSLAVCLSLAPYDASHPNVVATSSGSTTNESTDAVQITRTLSPALRKWKEDGVWNKDTLSAVPAYLNSLQAKYNIDTSALKSAWANARGDQKKSLATKLCLAKDESDMKATELEFCEEKTTDSTNSQWFSAWQVWQAESLPLCQQTQNARIAAVALLPRRPHANPIRREQGEFEFFYSASKTTAKTSHGHRFDVKAQSKMSGIDDYKSAKKNLKRAIGDQSDDKPTSRKGNNTPKKPQVAIEDLPEEDRKKAEQKKVKDEWIRSANAVLTRIQSLKNKLDQKVAQFSNLDIAKKIQSEVNTGNSTLEKHRAGLNKKLANVSDVQIQKFGSPEFKTLVDGATSACDPIDLILAKAGKAIELAKM